MKRILYLGIVLITSLSLPAQDLHFTQYNFSPLHVNPANCGLFKGSYRIGGIVRLQSFSIQSDAAYQTINFYLDATFPMKTRKNDWIGFGLNFLQDRSGVIGWGSGGFIAQAAYHLAVNSRSTISLGAQYGAVNFNIQHVDKAKSEQNILGSSVNPLSTYRKGAKYTDVTIGINLMSKLGAAKHDFELGFNAARVNRPSVTVLSTGGGQKLGTLITTNVGLTYHINPQFDLRNYIWLRNLKSATEIIPQCIASYLFNVEKSIRLNGGLGFRLADDAVEILLGADIKNLRFQIGIDQTVSSLKTAQSPNGLGAVEFGIMYTGSVIKKPNPKPKVFCPRF